MIGTCGHDITAEWDADHHACMLSLMCFDEDGNRGVDLGVFCKACRDFYEDLGFVLHGTTEEDKWLNGEIEYPATEGE